MADDDNNIRVCVRVRPLADAETQRGDGLSIDIVDRRTVKCAVPIDRRRMETQSYSFDAAFPPSTSQLEIFHHSGVEALCDFALEGFASTVFCFGQTGSGKTFTMSGPQDVEDSAKPKIDDPSAVLGLQYRAAYYLSDVVASLNGAGGPDSVIMRASFYEIYNEQVNDLLNETSDLKVRWSQNNQRFYVEQLMVVRCDGVDDLLAVLEQGSATRKRASHLLNVDSSRSHVVFSVMLERKQGLSPPRLGKVNFVDLAGSEKLRDSGSTGQMQTETKSINRSLFTLGKVISALATKGGAAFVPYRDSVLTKLLMDSIGGDCRTLMVACVTPSSRYLNETLSTLRYAARTRSIVNRTPTVRSDPQAEQIYELRSEIDRLRQENAQLRQLLEQKDAYTPLMPLAAGVSAANAYALPNSRADSSRDGSASIPLRRKIDVAPLDDPPPPPSVLSPNTLSRESRTATELANRVKLDNDRLRDEVATLRKLILESRMRQETQSPTKASPVKATSASMPIRPKLMPSPFSASVPSSAPVTSQPTTEGSEATFGYRPAPKKAPRLFFVTTPNKEEVPTAPTVAPSEQSDIRKQLEAAQRELFLYRLHQESRVD